jgi:hypothetical protein
MAVITAVEEKQRIQGILLKASDSLLWRDGSGFEAVTGEACSAVAPERLPLEEPLSILAFADATPLGLKPGHARHRETHRQDKAREQQTLFHECSPYLVA